MIGQTVTDLTNRIYKNKPLHIDEVHKLNLAYLNETGYNEIPDVNTILVYFQKKFHTVILTNKHNQFLKAFNYEEIINSPNGSSEEDCNECKSLSSKEEQSFAKS